MSWLEWALGGTEQTRATGKSAAAGHSTLVTGRFGSLSWEARLTSLPVSYGLNPRTLLKGRGRVARLVIYQHLGRPQVPHKLAVYDRGWLFGRKRHLGEIERIVAELGRRGAL